MNDLQIFNNPEFGEIRAVEIDGEPWFVGKDVAAALGYGDTDQALRKHIDDEDKLSRQFDGSGQNRNMTIINESGVYSLIFSSKLESAKQFKRWVTAEVLPSIRKHGAYIATQTPATLDGATLQAFTAAIDTLTATVQMLVQQMGGMKQGQRPQLPALTDDDNPFADVPVEIKPPTNKARRGWMHVASDKIDMLSDKCGLPGSSVLHRIYQEMEEEQGVMLKEVRLKVLEEHQLTDCSILLAIFYETPLRHWFERRVDHYLSAETLTW